MKKQPDNYLYLLKKVHGWCKRQGMTDPEMYFQCTFREFLRRYGMLLTKIETRNNQYGGHHTFTFTPAPGTEIFGGTNTELESVFDGLFRIRTNMGNPQSRRYHLYPLLLPNLVTQR